MTTGFPKVEEAEDPSLPLERKNSEEDYPKGLIVSFILKSAVYVPPDGKDEDEKAGVENNEDAVLLEDLKSVLPEDLKSVLQEFGNVKDIDFKTGDGAGYIQFEDAKGALAARCAFLSAIGGGLIVKDCIAFLRRVKGEAEKEYWTN